MKQISINLTDEMVMRLDRMARDSGRSLEYEIVVRLSETMLSGARARAAKVAIVAGTFAEAKEYAQSCGYLRDQWFYAHSIESVAGRYVRRIETVGTYRRHKNLDRILRDLHGGELAARAHARCHNELCGI